MNYNPNKLFIGALIAPRIGRNDSSLRKMYDTRKLVAGFDSLDEVLENASMCCYSFFKFRHRYSNHKPEERGKHCLQRVVAGRL